MVLCETAEWPGIVRILLPLYYSSSRTMLASNEVATRWSNLIPRRIGATWPAFDSCVYSSLLVPALLGWVLVPQMGPAHQASELLLQLAPLISLSGLDWIFPLCHGLQNISASSKKRGISISASIVTALFFLPAVTFLSFCS